ncbi:MAG: ThiF family adenylyltransferase [Chloroflexi bacterium]|nr:ThiF family adenylyltransferase [Chloroflexota bacterium]
MNIFDPFMHLQTVTVVGMGGTGSQVARTLARAIYDMRRARLHIPKLVFIDPDVVEEKNVGRQLFAAGDVGQNKSMVLARRFNQALGLEIAAIDQLLNIRQHIERTGNLVIGCVDNYDARRELAKAEGIWLDAGNHFDSGQVCIGNMLDHETMLRHIKGDNGKYRYLPSPALLFPQLLEPEPQPTPQANLSCADLVVSGDQHLLINDLVACVVAGYVYKLLHRQPITTFLSYVSIDSLSVRSLPICRDELMPYLQEPNDA